MFEIPFPLFQQPPPPSRIFGWSSSTARPPSSSTAPPGTTAWTRLTQEILRYATPRGEFPLLTTLEWGAGKSNKHGPPLPDPLLPPARRGSHPSPALPAVNPADSSVNRICRLSVLFPIQNDLPGLSGLHDLKSSLVLGEMK